MLYKSCIMFKKCYYIYYLLFLIKIEYIHLLTLLFISKVKSNMSK